MAKADLPKVSVIAPCRNEAGFIEQTIRDILNNDYPGELIELLIVDGMSTDGTRQIIQRMAARNNRIKLLDNPGKIQAAAMNVGIKAALGEYIIRVDCHAVYPSDYIRKSVELAKRTGGDNVGGYLITLPGDDTPVARAIAAATSNIFGVGNSIQRIGGSEQETDAAVFGTFRRETFNKIGLFDERLVRNEDTELNYRIVKAGGRIINSPEITVGYYNRATYRGLWQQSFNNGLWIPYTVWLVGGKGLSCRHFVPMFFVAGLISSLIGVFLWQPLVWIILAYILFYLSIACVFSLRSALQTKNHALLILWSFVVLHIAYGLGSIWGIMTTPFKFPDRHKKTPGKPLADRRM